MNQDLFKENLIELPEGIWEVRGLPTGEYDDQAAAYDKLISNALYNRIMWGNSPKDYAGFVREVLANCKNGIIADIGCGTLSFTSEVYADFPRKDLFLCDVSMEMLKIGKKRLELGGIEDNDPSHIFLRADAFNMPFKDSSVQTILSFGILHIFDHPSRLLSEFNRILKPEGELHLTSLCTDRKFSGWYLKQLQKKGHVAKPMDSQQIGRLVEGSGFTITASHVKGGMMYISASK